MMCAYSMKLQHRCALYAHKKILLDSSKSPEFLRLLNTQLEAESEEPQATAFGENANMLFNMLISGKIQFGAIVNHLQQSSKSDVASRLSNCAERFELLLDQLAHYYLSTYSNIHSTTRTPISVDKVRVALDSITLQGLSARSIRIDHMDLMKQLQSAKYTTFAVVQGDPGIGKSTVMKKIAFDWANHHLQGDNPDFPFYVVLAVPLSAVNDSDEFLRLAARYVMNVVDLPGFELEEFCDLLKSLDDKLLVYFDGLDEYAGFKDDSPFKTLFAEPFRFQSSIQFSNMTPPFAKFKVVITSRPYASKAVNEEFFPLQFQISPPNANNMIAFAHTYCHSPEAVSRFLKYVERNREVTTVTRMLTYLCYMADTQKEMPKNLPRLYQFFFRDMILREAGRHKLEESVDSDNWLQSSVVKCAARLAFDGCKRQRYQFYKTDIDRCQVPNDSFVSGFLLHRYDINEESFEADFAHRTAQEFFAALHLYHKMMDNVSDAQEKEELIDEICDPATLVGRFFFGFCSNNLVFDRLVPWLRPGIEGCRLLLFTAVDRVLLTVSHCLVDCESAEKLTMADCWLNLLSTFESTTTGTRELVTWPVGQPLGKMDLDQSFADGLHLIISQTANSRLPTSGWQIASDNFGVAKLRLVTGKPLEEALSTIQPANEVLVWQTAGLAVDDMLAYTALLPTARTLVIRTAVRCDCEVNFMIDYKNSPHIDGFLRHLSFGYAAAEKNGYQAKFQQIAASPTYISVKQVYSGGSRCNIMWIPVTVKAATRLEVLINDLLHLPFSHDFVSGKVVLPSNKKWWQKIFM